jgi:GT2 family glycosyltransferase
MGLNQFKLIIGFITYGKSTAKYLPYFLSSLKQQTWQDFRILVVDNSEEQDNENIKYIKKNYSAIDVEWAGRNIGFAKAYNKMIKKAVGQGAQYFFVINPDIILEPNVINDLINASDGNDKLGSVCPKIRQWDFINNKKTNIIDSCGIQLKPGLRFVDAGQGQVDKEQFDNVEILGPSGAAAMYRISALQKVKQDSQYFDELMFMYKEDCDLIYRLFLANFKSKCVSEAVIYHDRTAEAKGESNWQVALNRRKKSKQVKKWSFLNQQIIFIKYWKIQSIMKKLAVSLYAFKMFVFVLLFEQYLLKQYWELWKVRHKIKRYCKKLSI